MVRICKDIYTNTDYEEHFATFPFALSDFQKYAIEAIVSNNDILITAHTGSGKTLPAEFAIKYLVGVGKKVIYTSPIKALSNQKFYEMSEKFPDISFGILTGDIKFNPEADVLIMTTEILRNTLLFKTTSGESGTSSLLQFDMDINTELGAVVFDEVHYINDPGRGKVWEETIMLLPPHIQLVMLSATIDNPERFASWVENKANNTKTMYLAPTNHRVVPLVHYSYTCITDSIEKLLREKHKVLYSEIRNHINTPVIIKNAEKKYDAEIIKHAKMTKTFLYHHKLRVAPKYVLNQLVKHLNNNNMLPAICFVFSRKMVETYADSIEMCLHEEGSTIPSTVHQECRMILQRRIPNYKEYLNLPEFNAIIKLLEKGIAIHHSGILPVLREMTELLFSKGYIKLLFATETFAVGLNMPTKTVIMTSFSKFNGSNMHYLHPHEYTQMAGRAGRRGLDTIGHVIHTNNLFDVPYDTDYSNILNGSPLPLVSKYSTSDNTILTMIHSGIASASEIASLSSSSLSAVELENQKNTNNMKINQLKNGIEKMKEHNKYTSINNCQDVISEYSSIQNSIPSLRANQQKKAKMKLEKMEKENSELHDLIAYKKTVDVATSELKTLMNKEEELNQYYDSLINVRIDFLKEIECIEYDGLKITEKGNVSRLLQEVPGLLFGDIIVKTNFFEDLSTDDCIILFSTINNIRVKDDYKRHTYSHINCSETENVCEMLKILEETNNSILATATKYSIVPYDEELNYDVMEYIIEWIKITEEQQCHALMQKMACESEIFLGEFIKTIIKINNITEEMKKVAEYFQQLEFLNKLCGVSGKILKFVATNQSLYV
jgi:superfamily II RNA helicase